MRELGRTGVARGVLLAALIGWSTGAAAEPRRFAIAPQPLAAALAEFSRVTGVQVSAPGGLLEGRASPGVAGTIEPEAALDRLLVGTGLAARIEGGTVVLTQVGGEAVALPTLQVTGAAETAFGPVQGYRATRSATATRTDAAIQDTPASIQVVPREVIEDQAPRRLRDVYRNISGVQPDFTGGNVSATEVPIIRGFQDFSIYRNGFRSGQLAPVDFANIERIEVLKGPASVLFGLAEPGGLLNIVTKRPLADRFAILEQEIGSYDRYRTTIDANAPLTDDGSVLARINLAYTSDDTFRDHRGIDRIFLAPTLSWRPTAATELILDLSYSYEKYPFDHGLAFTADGRPIAPVSTFLGEPDFRSEREEFFAGYTLTHRLSDRVTLRNMTSFQYNENRLNAFRHFGSTNPDNTVNRSFDRTVPKGTVLQTVADIGYRFDLGPTRHELLFGIDARWEPKPGNQQDGLRSRGPFPISIINPQYGQFGAIVFDDSSDFDSEEKWFGLYLQDRITLFDDRLHLLVGGRFDYVDQFVKFVAPAFNFDFEGERQDSAFTGRVGALYKLTPWLSPYVSVSQSFNPVSPFTLGNVAPTEGFQVEGGFKLSFFQERLTATVAAYEVTKSNVPISDPSNPGFSINGGELRSRGFEIDIAGEIAPGLQLVAAYAYTDTEVLKSDSLPIGSRFRNVPLHSGSVWLRYDFAADATLAGFGFGAGVFGATDRLGDNAGSFELDGFLIADAAFWYRDTITVAGKPTPIKAQINVQNLFDREYYESSSGTASVFPGAPLTVLGSFRLRF